MDGIITLAILFFVFNFVIRMFKKAQLQAKQQAQQQAQQTAEAPKPRPVVKSVRKPDDPRFPSMLKPAPAPVAQEGRDPNAELTTYTPISPSEDMSKAFSRYQGSLDTTAVEGIGYMPEEYDNANEAYQTTIGTQVKFLPESFNRDVLVRAVVMSEILHRPGAHR